jgi:hypothetical protein
MDGSSGLSVEWDRTGSNGKVTLTAVLNGSPVYGDEINIKPDKARSGFIAALRAKVPSIDDAQATELEAKLLGIMVEATAKKDDTAAPADAAQPDPIALLTEMPKAVVVEAKAMLDDANLMQRVVDDIGLLGVAGEKELRATVYLIGVSRLLDQPLAGIVQGPSSSGKSYVIKKTASLFPPETILRATQLTAQALFYMQPGSLVHRFVVVGERSRAENDDTADTTRALREMLSEGRLSKALPVKVNGLIETKLIEQDGPIAYIESTTLTKVFAEDANRCIMLTTDEQPEQTRRIISALAAGYARGMTADAQRIIDRHHALQRLLQAYSVIVPYAERLGEAIDSHPCEARRAFPQVVSLIQASALLHQRQRQVDADGRLIAGADDYRLARHLLAVPMARQLGGRVSDGALRFLKRLREWFGRETFTKPDAKAKETGSQSSVYGWMAELHDAGLIERVEEQHGNRAARWRVSADADDPQAAAVLPAVEAVCPKGD